MACGAEVFEYEAENGDHEEDDFEDSDERGAIKVEWSAVDFMSRLAAVGGSLITSILGSSYCLARQTRTFP